MHKLGSGCIVSEADVETLAFDWGTIRLLSEPKLTGAQRMTGGVVDLAPGKGHERHSHPGTEEILFVLTGQGEQMVDDQGPVRVGPGASIFVPDGVAHSTVNTGSQPLRLFVVYAPTGAEIDLRQTPGCKLLPPGQKA